MYKIGPKQHKQTTVALYYVTVVFNLLCKSESRFTMYLNPDSLIKYPLNSCLYVNPLPSTYTPLITG